MKIVIDVDDNLYVRLFDNGTDLSIEDMSNLERTVRKGTPRSLETKDKTIDRVLEIIDEIERDTGHVALIGDDNKFAGVLCNSSEFRDRVLALKGIEK